MTLSPILQAAGGDTYRGMSREAIDLAYDNGAVFPDVPEWRTRWIERSEAVDIGTEAQLDVPYGEHARQKLDIFPVGDPAAPTLLFFHGGFWARNSKETFRFLVDAFHRAGFNAVFAGYTLAPVPRFAAIAEDAARATLHLVNSLPVLGFASRPLCVVGWSAGAHLAVLLEDHPDVSAILAISGIYDLEPMRIGSMNSFLNLSLEDVQRYSPTRYQRARTAPITIAYGASELPEFQLQSTDFVTARQAQGRNVQVVPLAGCHHHRVLEALYDPTGSLNHVLAHMKEITP